MNKNLSTTIIVLAVVVLGYIYFSYSQPFKLRQPQEKTASLATSQSTDEVISKTGIHWHPELAISIKGQRQIIPANIGIGMQYASYPLYDPMMMMTDVHTHDNSGTLHWEIMEGPVKKEDVRLASFFAIWGKKFDGSCILEYCNGPEGTAIMFVNGQPSTEFQNYLVKDGDQVEIRYE